MLSAAEAEALILDRTLPLTDVEVLPLEKVAGRILAAPVMSKLDFPHWDNSAMDGYAVRFADVQQASTENPIALQIVEEIPAGYAPQKSIAPGQAARIFTGGMLPDGADTIVIQEVTQRQGDRVTILEAPKPKAFVRSKAEFYQAGAPLLPAGLQIGAQAIAVLAAAQCTEITVYRRPRVAIFSTGDELVQPNQPLAPGQIVDSNQYALAALVAAAGAEPIDLGIVPDRPEALKAAIEQAISQADLVISSGGVSVGDYDYVDRILDELGAKLHVRSVAVKPGKPLTVATFANRSVLYFGLPGNPVSALVSFWRFVEPALRKLSGLPEGWRPVFVQGRTMQALRSDGKRESYLWGQVCLVEGEYQFQLAGGSHSSGNLINLAATNGLAIVPIGQTQIAAGDRVLIMLVGRARS
ncbi:molybdopterin molybdotransferase MoeA [Microcoleus sp. FACHB-1515]|uniref:molybdopterin molybdotransferase MoeA n=1 Tax=Cyanophyceae TaxID=3028117 RepID=UPI001686C92A|nr:gephyrin-like molybdotransferase Glp [Microcoleus sp. FACHB-1515]MBD2091051.1 molybdopterin molybdotransferase MoeA [Microcoleus sp. FACHB-1515]